MNTEEVKELLKQEDLPFEVFLDWMAGQTVGFKDGVTDFYDDDVQRFVRSAKKYGRL